MAGFLLKCVINPEIKRIPCGIHYDHKTLTLNHFIQSPNNSSIDIYIYIWYENITRIIQFIWIKRKQKYLQNRHYHLCCAQHRPHLRLVNWCGALPVVIPHGRVKLSMHRTVWPHLATQRGCDGLVAAPISNRWRSIRWRACPKDWKPITKHSRRPESERIILAKKKAKQTKLIANKDLFVARWTRFDCFILTSLDSNCSSFFFWQCLRPLYR